MLRYLMKHTFRDGNNNCEGTNYYTVDGDAKQVEMCLTSGGRSEDGHDRHELVGVEVIYEKK